MVTKTVKTYACKKAINASRNIIIVTRVHGKKDKTVKKAPFINKSHANPIKIFNKAWPDIIFAKSRILKLKTLAKYDTISIKIKKGAIAKGTPLGKNKFGVVHVLLKILIILIPIKYDNAKKNVITKELVTVKEYGINPTTFATKI
jgi:hypothetical protein